MGLLRIFIGRNALWVVKTVLREYYHVDMATVGVYSKLCYQHHG